MENKGLLPNNVEIGKSGSIIKSILKFMIFIKKTKDLNAFDFGI